MLDRGAFCFAGWQDLFAVFGTAREVALRLGRGAKLRRAFEGGALPAEFLAFVEDSIGLNAEARERRSREGDGSYGEGSTSGEVETDFFADLSPDTTFSIAPSSPERDARPLPELGIPDGRLGGDGRADWRRAVRDAIAADLQGTSIVNKDTGESIRFTSQSKGESVSKLRHEPAYRSALEMGKIAAEAVLLGSVAPGKGRTDTLRFDYYAMPVTVDGRRQVAWFNVRVIGRGEQAVFYEFGLFDKKRTPASQRLGVELPPPNTSQPGLKGTIGAFLAEIKETLPAAVKVAADLSMSLAPLGPSVLDALRSDFSKPAETYNFEHYDEIRPRILEIAAEEGVRLTASRDLSAGARRLGEALGIEIFFYEGGDPREGGFTPKGNPDLVFLNCRPVRRGVPVSWTLSHEILHVAQKDGRAKAGDLDEAVRKLIGPEELEAIDRELEARGYAKESYATERPAFLTGDAISGLSLFGLDSLSRAGEIRKLIEHYFSALGVLSPESLAQVDDRELARNYDGSRSSPEPGSTFALAPLGSGPREIREAPRLLERKENPFSNSAAKTPKEWRAEWSGWIQAHRKEWEGEGPVELPEGPVVIGTQARDHVRSVAAGENPRLHFEAAVRMRELLENSELVDVQAPRDYEKAASEIHRRYAWMAFEDGVPRHVLLTVKRWDESRGVDEDSMYALEALEVTEPDDLQVENSPSPENLSSVSPGSGGSLARFLAGIKPEHRWMSGADDAGAGRTFSLGDPRSWGDAPDSRGRGTGSDPSGRKGGKRIENPNSDDKRLSDQTGPDFRTEGARGGSEEGALQAAIDELGRIAAADAAGVSGGSAEDFGRREAREWAVVARAAENAPASERFVLDPALVFAEGGESRIEAWRDGRLLKHLKRAGFVLALGKGIMGRDALVLRPALPSELLERFAITKEHFGDTIRPEGFTVAEDGRPTFVFSQNAIKGSHPSVEEIESLMAAAGFSPVPDDGRIADFHLSHRTWIEQRLHLLVTDGKPQNFKKDEKGVVYPIDLIAQKVRDPKMWEVLTR